MSIGVGGPRAAVGFGRGLGCARVHRSSTTLPGRRAATLSPSIPSCLWRPGNSTPEAPSFAHSRIPLRTGGDRLSFDELSELGLDEKGVHPELLAPLTSLR